MYVKHRSCVYKLAAFTGTQLDVYDFDQTLFKDPITSPPKPAAFFDTLESLEPPCVPEKPDSSWWVTPTVAAARKSIGASGTYTLFMTGRQEDPFQKRVMELLEQQNLVFDQHHLRPSASVDDLEWKREVLRSVLEDFPSVQSVHLWDDKADHLASFSEMVKDELGLEVEATLVKAPGQATEC